MICLGEDFTKPVVLLACGHAFCFVCLAAYYDYRRVVSTTTMQSDADDERSGVLRSACPKCRKTLIEVDASIELALIYSVRAKRRGESNEDKLKHYTLALEETKQVAMYAGGERAHPVVFGCRGLLALDVWGKPKEAIQMLDIVVKDQSDLNEEAKLFEDRRDSALAKLSETLDAVESEEAQSIRKKFQRKILSLGHRLAKNAFVDVQLKLGQAKEAISEWTGAMDIYNALVFDLLKRNVLGSFTADRQERELLMGKSRCLYYLGDYADAAKNGMLVVMGSRYFPGVHRLVAQAQKAGGDADAAKKNMSQAVFYELPWDSANARNAREYLEELKTS